MALELAYKIKCVLLTCIYKKKKKHLLITGIMKNSTQKIYPVWPQLLSHKYFWNALNATNTKTFVYI